MKLKNTNATVLQMLATALIDSTSPRIQPSDKLRDTKPEFSDEEKKKLSELPRKEKKAYVRELIKKYARERFIKANAAAEKP